MLLQELLKLQTRENHDQLEELMFVHEIMDKTLTLDQYKTLLMTNYLVHASIEHQIFDSLGVELNENLCVKERYKLNALRKDMQEAGITASDVDLLTTVPAGENFFSIAAGLGAMYVLEGATMGGQVIQKKLKANPVFKGFNFHYYTIYGDKLMARWKSFIAVLNTTVPESDYALVVKSAAETFEYIADVSQRIMQRYA